MNVMYFGIRVSTSPLSTIFIFDFGIVRAVHVVSFVFQFMHLSVVLFCPLLWDWYILLTFTYLYLKLLLRAC